MRLYNYHYCCSYLNFFHYFMILIKRKVREKLYRSYSKAFLFSGVSSLSLLYFKLCYFHSDYNYQLSNFRKANSVKHLFNSINHNTWLNFVVPNDFLSFCFLYFYSMEVQYRSKDKNFQSLTEYI